MSRTSSHAISEIVHTADLPASEVHRIFSSKRRRIALKILYNHTGTMELGELAGAIAENELSSDDSTSIAISLHHLHLPAMDDLGIVSYDHQASEVTLNQRDWVSTLFA